MYDLKVDGITAFIQRRPEAQRQMRRQPLIGLVGSNKEFMFPTFPVLSTSVKVYVANALVLPANYTLDADMGVVLFNTAPSAQPTADCVAMALSNQQIAYYAWAGFSLMESMWTRNYLLTSSNTAFAFASPTSDHIYVCQGPVSTGGVVTDPSAGQLTFSTSQLQREWMARCMEMAYLDSMQAQAALSDVNVRERMGGIQIQTDHRSQSIGQAKERLWRELWDAMYAALDEWDPSMAHYGGAVDAPHSTMYQQQWQWQTDGTLNIPVLK